LQQPIIRKSFAAAVAVTVAAGISFSAIIWPGGAVANAAEIKVLSADVFTGVLDELAGGFERTTGHKVTIVYGSAGAIRSRVEAGEIGDVTILPRPMMDEVLRQGKITPGSIVDVARSAVGVAVRTGAPKPDISSVDALARSLLAAKSISYPNPARGGATGVLFTRVLERLGMTEAMKPKTKFPPVGKLAVDVVAGGEAEMAISQPMEVLAQPGVELVGLLPPELQDLANFVFSASVLAAAKEPQAAKALIQFLSGPVAASVLRTRGMDPG
jgi:molybdate transport system substrate-binding protein